MLRKVLGVGIATLVLAGAGASSAQAGLLRTTLGNTHAALAQSAPDCKRSEVFRVSCSGPVSRCERTDDPGTRTHRCGVPMEAAGVVCERYGGYGAGGEDETVACGARLGDLAAMCEDTWWVSPGFPPGERQRCVLTPGTGAPVVIPLPPGL